MTRSARYIVCISQDVKKYYESLNPSFDKGRITIVHNGVDVNIFKPGNPKAALPIHSDGKKIVSLIGRLEPWKGQDVFIKAARLVLEKRKDVIFLIVGGAFFGREDYEAECIALSRQIGVEESVKFLGFREDMPQIISSSDIIVHTSVKPEPFGRDVIEAMSSGKPVVSTDIGGPSEIITAGSGMLIKPGDPGALAKAVLMLLNDHAAMAKMGHDARKRIEERFDIRNTTKRLEDVFERLVKDRSK